jgi:glycosyltransferase involved in cell wall biosynthesis
MKISVCVATFGRPNLLRRLLESLSMQSGLDSIELEVVVIGTDPTGAVRRICEEFSSLHILYMEEPVRGIARARNRGVENASGSSIAFIDDDERASRGWLMYLSAAMEESRADIVSGPVQAEYPDEVPEWVMKSKVHEKRGTMMGVGTSNLLIRRSALDCLTDLFDEALDLSGGEDVDLLERLVRNGARSVWEERALVYELIPKERCRIGWLIQRRFRAGLTYARRRARYDGALGRTRNLLAGIIVLAGSGLLLPVSLLGGRFGPIRVILRGVGGAGRVAGSLGATYEEYRHFPGEDFAAKTND